MKKQVRTNSPLVRCLHCFAIALCLAFSGAQYAQAQHIMTINSNSDVELESSPVDDEVLESSPNELMLRFSTYVKLVKLTMTSPEEKFVNIGFRYDPDLSRVFFLDLPELKAAAYYTVEWTAIDPSNLVARGSFSFSFGPDAAPPSTLIPVEEELDPFMAPDYRLIDQSF